MVIEKSGACTSCGTCVAICPRKCLELKLNNEGFYSPTLVKVDECNNCGLCDRVCTKETNVMEVNPVGSYSFVSTDKEVLRTTSSGGLCYELARQAIKDGKKVCACIYDYNEHVAKHRIVSDIEGLEKTKGSKYIQSNTPIAFEEVLNGEQYTVFGTPCQITSLAKAAKIKGIRDKLLLVDFFCHGTPSMFLWKKYVDENGGSNIVNIGFRSKEKGWRKFSLTFEYKDGQIKSDYGDNMFYNFFFNNNCLNSSCYECSHKALKSSADIRVGDFWGKKYANNDKGVSSCLALTEKGKEALISLVTGELVHESIGDVIEGQMIMSPQKRAIRKKLLKVLKGKKSLKKINSTTMLPYRLKCKIASVLRRGR